MTVRVYNLGHMMFTKFGRVRRSIGLVIRVCMIRKRRRRWRWISCGRRLKVRVVRNKVFNRRSVRRAGKFVRYRLVRFIVIRTLYRFKVMSCVPLIWTLIRW